MLISGLYLVLFLLSVLAVYILLREVSNSKASYYVVLFTLIAVVCLAYFAYSIADDASMALVANQFTYFDGTFLLLFFLLCVMKICGIEIKPIVAIPLTICSLVILGLAFTTSKFDIFYKSVEFEQYMGSSHLVMDFGPLHKYFLAYVILNTLAPIGIVIYSLFNRKKISYKNTLALALLEISIVLLYFVQFHFSLGFDLLPCGYVLMEYVILAIIQRVALYDGTQIVLDNSENRMEYGYIIFDRNGAYVGSNNVARYYFPEISQLDIDRPVKNEFIKTEFVDRIDPAKEEISSMVYSRNDKILVCTIKPYRHGKKGNVYGYIVEMRDDTEQQQLIQRLNYMNEDLEAAVDTANRANSAKSDFLANMSHEIRTPINAILGMNEIALRECEDEKLITYLDDIRNAGNNLLFIINDILDFSKIEAGKIDIIKNEYNIAKTVKDVKDLIQIKAQEKGLKLTVEVDSQLPTSLNGDENRIRQIMVNILNNAVKYTPSGSVKFTVGKEYTAGQFKLRITVSDTGIGIKQEDIEKLFDSFTRVDESKNKNIEGTGLGLAITKRLISMMKGTIDVSSIYGEGTTFDILLPQEILNNEPIGDFASLFDHKAKKDNKTHIDASSLDILIVDDTRVNLAVAKGLLKPTKAKVDTCASGAECLEMLQKKHYDVVLLDQMMPQMDGIQTRKEAMKLEGNMSPDAKYIALTANAISGVKEMFLAEGFDDYISKPIDSKQLERTIEKYINQSTEEN